MARLGPKSIVSLYALVGALWVLCSDQLAGMLFSASPKLYAEVSILKGWAFVAVTSAMLYDLLRRYDIWREEQQQALSESQERFRILVENAPEAIVVFDMDTERFVEANPVALTMLACPRDELLASAPGRFDSILESQDPAERERVQMVFSRVFAGESVLLERPLRRADGKRFRGELRLSHLPQKGRRLVRASCLDITERSTAQEKLQAALEEKSALLREIHHRVKNNLQIVISLVHLQNASGKTSQACADRLAGRIRSMALVHDQLYGSRNLAAIDMGRYLHSLALSVAQVHQGRATPSLRFDLASQDLDIARAVPFALLANELLSNAFNHAFPPDSPGIIQVELHVENGRLRLAVIDDGRGMDPGPDLKRAESMGFVLVRELAGQLGATVSADTSHGCRFEVEFPL
ncbi:hypothetical protein JCM15519_28840 [Fundidesulfovibrio butyratiphilus]